MVGRAETGQEIKGSLVLSTEGKDSTGERKETNPHTRHPRPREPTGESETP